MKTDFEKLTEIINEAEGLLSKYITSDSPEFKAWKMRAEKYLISHYGEQSHEYTEFKKLDFTAISLNFDLSHSDNVASCHRDIESAIAVFKVYLEDVEETSDHNQTQPMNYSKVFIVHGHDSELKESVARLIEKQEIEAIILSEQVNQGRTIIEKFEDYCDVGGAICLFTADDIGKSKLDSKENYRARQNVVFETGYFMGKLGRAHVVIISDKGIEIPSDLAGVVYTDASNWQVSLLQELLAMGYNIDFNKLFK